MLASIQPGALQVGFRSRTAIPSQPWRRRLAQDGALFGKLTRIFVKTVQEFYAERAAREGAFGAKTGAVTVVQRSEKLLVFVETRPGGDALMTLAVEGDEETGWKPGVLAVFLSAPFHLHSPVFSPDGRWLAHTSDESGRDEVYVRPFPAGDGGGRFRREGAPRWSGSRPELLYGTADGKIMVVSYTVDGDSFRPGKPTRWSDVRFVRRLTAEGEVAKP